ncbi:MAG: beta-ketoacyl-[acyl-carrier-protein] synthase family protein [Ardenticatenaceae bacterium]
MRTAPAGAEPPASLDRVVITGMGVITPLGCTVEALWGALLAGQCAARSWPDLEAQGFRIAVACRVPEFVSGEVERGERMAVAAARLAVAHAGASRQGRVGVYVGTTMGSSAAFERAAEGEPLDLERAAASAFPRAVQQALDAHGPAQAYGTACAAGNYAIGAGADAVRAGWVDVAVAGGVDAFSRIAMAGFSRSRAMTPDRCRPFNARRQGMQLGEAAAFVVLERAEDARARGAQVFASVEALGLSCDAYHATAPKPDGSGMAAAIEQALRSGRVAPEEIGFICAHGTGTRASDLAEACAIRHTFPHPPPVSGIKGALGHSLGAATAVEAVVTALALYHKCLPPTTNLEEIDPEISLDVVREARPSPGLRWALNCGYAFGGLNSALVMGAV